MTCRLSARLSSTHLRLEALASPPQPQTATAIFYSRRHAGRGLKPVKTIEKELHT